MCSRFYRFTDLGKTKMSKHCGIQKPKPKANQKKTFFFSQQMMKPEVCQQEFSQTKTKKTSKNQRTYKCGGFNLTRKQRTFFRCCELTKCHDIIDITLSLSLFFMFLYNNFNFKSLPFTQS